MSESQIDRLEKILNSDDPSRVNIRPDGSIEECVVESPVPADNPLSKAWNAYTGTFAYERTQGWALQIAPMSGSEATRRFELMPFEQRKNNVEGSLWAAFYAGWEARDAAISQDTEQCDAKPKR